MNSPEKPIWKKIISFGIPIIGLFFAVQSIVSVYSLWKRGDVIDERELILLALEKEQTELKNEYSDSFTQSFIEKEARNKLGLVKPGETIVYLDKDASASAKQEKLEKEEKMVEIPPFQQWLRLFF
jgi:hypothetical protein